MVYNQAIYVALIRPDSHEVSTALLLRPLCTDKNGLDAMDGMGWMAANSYISAHIINDGNGPRANIMTVQEVFTMVDFCMSKFIIYNSSHFSRYKIIKGQIIYLNNI